jgi:hypothetical protein
MNLTVPDYILVHPATFLKIREAYLTGKRRRWQDRRRTPNQYRGVHGTGGEAFRRSIGPRVN